MSLDVQTYKKTMSASSPFPGEEVDLPKQELLNILGEAQLLFIEVVELRKNFRGLLERLIGLNPEEEEDKLSPSTTLSGCITETRSVIEVLRTLHDSISRTL